jgi:hypothetical protein
LVFGCASLAAGSAGVLLFLAVAGMCAEWFFRAKSGFIADEKQLK